MLGRRTVICVNVVKECLVVPNGFEVGGNAHDAKEHDASSREIAKNGLVKHIFQKVEQTMR